MTFAKEVSNYELDLVGVQDVGWMFVVERLEFVSDRMTNIMLRGR